MSHRNDTPKNLGIIGVFAYFLSPRYAITKIGKRA